MHCSKMTLPLILCFGALFPLTIQKTNLNIKEVCDEVKAADTVVEEHLRTPVEANCEQIFVDIEEYFTKVEKLINCLKQDKNTTIEECNETVMEGEPKFMVVQFDYWKLMDGFRWNQTQVMKYMDWRDKTLYLWQKVDEASGRNSVYPKLA